MAAAPLKPPGEEDDLDENMQVNINPRIGKPLSWIRIQIGLRLSLARGSSLVMEL